MMCLAGSKLLQDWDSCIADFNCFCFVICEIRLILELPWVVRGASLIQTLSLKANKYLQCELLSLQ